MIQKRGKTKSKTQRLILRKRLIEFIDKNILPNRLFYFGKTTPQYNKLLLYQ